jgi:hypothetical protein
MTFRIIGRETMACKQVQTDKTLFLICGLPRIYRKKFCSESLSSNSLSLYHISTKFFVLFRRPKDLQSVVHLADDKVQATFGGGTFLNSRTHFSQSTRRATFFQT